MNKTLPILLILFASFLYSLFWNPYRWPQCETAVVETKVVSEETTPSSASEAPEPISESERIAIEKTLLEPLNVYFELNSSNLIRTQQIKDWLDLAKKYLIENPKAQLSLTGYSDNTGSLNLNMNLSKKRAESVRDLLMAEGFKSDNLRVYGKGPANPIADNDTDEGRAKNRRVAIQLVK